MAGFFVELEENATKVWNSTISYLIIFGVRVIVSLLFTISTLQIINIISVVKNLSEPVKLAVATKLYATAQPVV
jgi:hypothetical protein